MIFDFFPVLAFWSGLLWGLAGCVIAFLAFLMILSIVFLQDSKEGGLGGAFGSAGGGDSVLGASGQKGIVKVTAWLSIIFFVMVIGWGMIGSSSPGSSDGKIKDILDRKTPDTAGERAPGASAEKSGPGVGPAPPPDGENAGAGGSSGGSDN